MKPTRLILAFLVLALAGIPGMPVFAGVKVVTTLQDLASLTDAVGGTASRPSPW